ncbi:Ig-like domain-containing protein [candidate division KSB1 bacterium]|nr:Ig-like domain-containing protein [candidate division KSB1 bacterium]
MTTIHRIFKWVEIISIGFFIVFFGWIACSQKAPLDPTQPIHQELPYFTSIIATPQIIVVNSGLSHVSVQLVDTDGALLLNELVRFSATLGTIEDSIYTDTTGTAHTIFRAGSQVGEAVITASYNNIATATIKINVSTSIETKLFVASGRSTILANGIDTTAIKITLSLDSLNTSESIYVSISTANGSRLAANSVKVNSEGNAKVVLTSLASRTDVTEIITANYGDYTDVVDVALRGITFQVDANPDVILADGQSSSLVSAIVKETTSLVSIPNASITFGVDHGLISNTATTDTRGQALASLTSSTYPVTANVYVRYGTEIDTMMQVNFVSATESALIISEMDISENALLSNGIQGAEVAIKIVDKDYNPVSGDSVQFVSTAGVMDPEWVVTGSDGQAQSLLYAKASRYDSTVTVTAYRGYPRQSRSIQNIQFIGVSLEVDADPDTIVADGKSTSIIAVSLKGTTSRVGISGATIYFGADKGTINNSVVTNSSGTANITFTAASTSELVDQIHVHYGDGIDTSLTIRYVREGQSVYNLVSLETVQNAIIANGIAQAGIQARVEDDDGNPVSNVFVYFDSDTGSIPNREITNSSGVATAYLTSDTSQVDIWANVDAYLNENERDEVQVLFQGIKLSVSALPDTILGDGHSESIISALLKLSETNIIIPDERIYFQTNLGTFLTGSAVTNTTGKAEATLVSESITEDMQVSDVYINYGAGMRRRTQVVFERAVAERITLNADLDILLADGTSETEITARVTNEDQVPVAGETIRFDIINGNTNNDYWGSVSPTSVVTDANGLATTTLTSSEFVDTVNVRSYFGQLNENPNHVDSVEVIYIEGTVDQIIMNIEKFNSSNGQYEEADSIKADGIDKVRVKVTISDAQDHSLPGVPVEFSATIGNIQESVRTDENGEVVVYFTSTQVGVATITAVAGGVFVSENVQVVPGDPYDMTITYDPHFMYVKDTGKNATVTITANVVDEKGNPVADSTDVRFRVYASPDDGDALSNTPEGQPHGYTYMIPTVGGRSQVSYTAGTRSGASRIEATVFDDEGTQIIDRISTEIVIFGGPPYIENILDQTSSHLTVATARLNIWHILDTTQVTVMVGDKYNNPVQEGTAVYLTASGGVVSTVAYTDEYGIAIAQLQAGNPQPTLDRWYTYDGLTDPNTGTVIEMSTPDFENEHVFNYYTPAYFSPPYNYIDGYEQNNGITRIIAWTEGVTGDPLVGYTPARAWDMTGVVYSSAVPSGVYPSNAAVIDWGLADTTPPYQGEDGNYTGGPQVQIITQDLDPSTEVDTLQPGQSIQIDVYVWDANGNPIVAGSTIKASHRPDKRPASVDPGLRTTGDPGITHYTFGLTNNINPEEPKDTPGDAWAYIEISSRNGEILLTSDKVYMYKPIIQIDTTTTVGAFR